MHYCYGKKQMYNLVHNLFHSAMLCWPNQKLLMLLLDPMTQFQHSDISPHPNLDIYMYNFVQDFIFSIHRQRQIFYGEQNGN